MSTSSISLSTGVSKQLDGKAQPGEVVQPSDVSDTTTVARLFTRILGSVAALQRAYAPRSIIFRDIATTGTSTVPVTINLTHKFGCNVDWWIVRCRGLNPLATFPIFVETSSDGQTLTLLCYGTATFDLCLQEAG